MFRCDSRIERIITGLRAERLQEITEEDALLEGVYGDESYEQATPTMCYEALWDSLNAKRGYPWAGNWWVWVIDWHILTLR